MMYKPQDYRCLLYNCRSANWIYSDRMNIEDMSDVSHGNA